MTYRINSDEIMKLLAAHITDIFPDLTGRTGTVSLYAKGNDFWAEFTPLVDNPKPNIGRIL